MPTPASIASLAALQSRNRTLRPANEQESVISESMTGATTGRAGASCLASISKPSVRKAAGSPCGWSNATPLSAPRIGRKPCENSNKHGQYVGNLQEGTKKCIISQMDGVKGKNVD